jgi:hypothetical protein
MKNILGLGVVGLLLGLGLVGVGRGGSLGGSVVLNLKVGDTIG